MNPAEAYGIGAVCAAVIGILFWIIKWLFNKGTSLIDENIKATQKNTEVNHEMFTYLKHKNGQMEECFERVVTNQGRIATKLDKIDKRYIDTRIAEGLKGDMNKIKEKKDGNNAQ